MEDNGVVVQSDENGMEIEPRSPVPVSKTDEELGNTVKNSSAKKRQRREPVTPTVERPFRERKLVERFVVKVDKEVKEFKIEKGTGTALKDIPNVVYKLSKRKATDEIVQLLHRILYGRQGKAHTAKTNIQQFSGFVWALNEEKEKQKVKDKLEKCVKESLIQMSELLDLNLPKSSKKEDAVVKLLEFLESPYKASDKLLEEKVKAAKLKKAKKKLKKAKKAKTIGQTPQKKKKAIEEKAGDDDNDVDEDDEDEEDGSSSGAEVEPEDGSDYEEYSTKSAGSKKRGRQTPKKSRKQETDDEENGDDEDGEQEEVEDKEEDDTDEKMSEHVIEDQTKANSPPKSQIKLNEHEATTEVCSEVKEDADGMDVAEEEKSVNNKLSEPEATEKAKEDSGKKGKKTPKKQVDDTEAMTEEKAEKETKKSKKQSVSKDASTPKAKPAKKQESASTKKSAQKPTKGDVKPKKQKSEEPKLPSDDELRAAIAKILEDADFSKVTFTDVLRQLGENFKVDFTSNKAHVKALIQEEIAKLVNEGDDSEEEEEEEEDGDKEEDRTGKAEEKDTVADSDNINEVSKPEEEKDCADAAEREDSN